jgi:replication factor C subunit 2/4
MDESDNEQSRCAILRFTRLSDTQILKRLLEVIKEEGVPYTPEGLEALIFTSGIQMDVVRLSC